MLRAVRFAAQLAEFRIEQATLDAIKAESAYIALVSKERVTAELSKIWAVDAAKGWLLLQETDLLQHIVPAAAAKAADINDAFHRLASWDAPAELKVIMGWALVAFRIAKESSIKQASDYMVSLFRLSNADQQCIALLLSFEQLVSASLTVTDVVRHLVRSNAGLLIAFVTVIHGWSSVSVTSVKIESMRLISDPPALDQVPRGHDFMPMLHGPQIGQAIKAAENAIFERRARTKTDAIAIALASLGITKPGV